MSQPQFQQRHFDYVIGPNQDSRLASVAAGATVRGIELLLDTDAPFLLRGRAYRVAYLDGGAWRLPQTGIENLSLRYAGPIRDWRSQGMVPQHLLMPFGGQGGAWKPVYPQIPYPAGSVLEVELTNNGATALTNLTLYWRGVKLFPWGVNPNYQYPKRFRSIPFVYPIGRVLPTNLNGTIQNVLATGDVRTNQVFQVGNDADFVLRYGQSGPGPSAPGLEVAFILYDENKKAFSNDYVHHEVLFGPTNGTYNTGSGGSITAAGSTNGYGTQNGVPSCMYPELYIPRNHIMYWDMKRTAQTGIATTPDFPVNLVGAKVYPQ